MTEPQKKPKDFFLALPDKSLKTLNGYQLPFSQNSVLHKKYMINVSSVKNLEVGHIISTLGIIRINFKKLMTYCALIVLLFCIFIQICMVKNSQINLIDLIFCAKSNLCNFL